MSEEPESYVTPDTVAASQACQKALQHEKFLGKVTDIFGAIADEKTLRAILILLMNPDGMSVNDLVSRAHTNQPNLSHKLTLLKAHGILDATRAGKENIYRVTDEFRQSIFPVLLSANSSVTRADLSQLDDMPTEELAGIIARRFNSFITSHAKNQQMEL